MKSFFKDKQYGAINYYFIVCEAWKTELGYEKFTYVTRPRFKEHDKMRNLDGSIEMLEGVYFKFRK